MNTESDKRKRPPSEQFAARLMEKSDPPDESVRDAFEEARPRSREDIMLDVRFSTGTRRAFSYHFLVKIEYEPGDTLRMFFGSDVVRIEGRQLGALYETLRQHKAKYVQEGSAAEDSLKPSEVPHIDAITMEQTEEKS